MLLKSDIVNFINKNNYDVRISKNARWIDQKCTPDVLTIIADCVYNYTNNSATFTTKDIWQNDYTKENVAEIFKKPSVTNDNAKNEYDKFFQQPLELMAYSGVLNKTKNGNKNLYSIQNIDILGYIATRELNALFFLQTYIKKVLTDSGIYNTFEEFFKYQNKNYFNDVKRKFSEFTIQNTEINGELECNRIFTKVINPIAFENNSCGTERGRLSKHRITLDMLMYNRNNFRDIYRDKPKDVTRNEYLKSNPIDENDIAYYKYQSVKAKKYLRDFNNKYRASVSEHLDSHHNGEQATNMHHIFPEAEYREISAYYENIIALTPTQHYNYAHPNAKTQEINKEYQNLLLLSKADRIQENLNDSSTDDIYI